jgi:hypothetical protein
VESNQVRLVPAAVFRDGQQFSHALEPGLTREVVRDATDGDRLNRIHDDMSVVHPVPATHFDMGPHPDADRASDSALSDALAKPLGEQHQNNCERATVFQIHVACSCALPLAACRKAACSPPPLKLRRAKGLPRGARKGRAQEHATWIWKTPQQFEGRKPLFLNASTMTDVNEAELLEKNSA